MVAGLLHPAMSAESDKYRHHNILSVYSAVNPVEPKSIPANPEPDYDMQHSKDGEI